MPAFVTVPLLSVTTATPRSRVLTLDLRNTVLAFLPGQAVMIGDHAQSIRRPYSIASSPERADVSRALELLVGLDEAGSPGPHLPSLAPGVALDVEGPFGSFTFPESPSQRRLLFVGGGTGIAPLRAMMDHAMHGQAADHIALLYSARKADEFAFIDEFRRHAGAGRIELHQTVTRGDDAWSGGRGRIGRAHFEAVLHDPTRTLCFVCGPAAMVSEAVATLAGLGVPREAIRTEQWNATT